MSDYYDIDGIICDEDGEIIDTAVDSPLLLLAQRRHEYKQQMEQYRRDLQVIDRVLLKNQTERKAAYGNVVLSVRGGRYAKFEGEAFANLLMEDSWDADPELVVRRLLNIIAASTGFRTDQDREAPERTFLDKHTAALYEKARTWHEKRPWLESSIAKVPAPELRRVPAEEVAS